jgi:predicted methyltransferase
MRILLCLLVLSLPSGVACGGSQPASPTAPVASGAPAPSTSSSVAEVPAATAQTAAAPPAASAEPTAEEKKKAEEMRELAEDKAKWEKDDQAELARWTPELHASVKALADKSYPSGRAAIQAALAGQQRVPGHADRDKYRHPLESLEFFGFKPSMTVLEIGPGEGWYTEILAPALAAKGKLIATTSDPNGPDDQRSTLNGRRFRAFLEKAPEAFGKVQSVVVDSKAPSLDLAGTVDLVVAMREVHGMINSGTFGPWLSTIQSALKPGGVLGVEEHRAPAEADPVESAKKGYVPEKWLIAQVEAAGLKLAGKSEINANPKDTKDYAEGVWTLPPSFALGDKDKEKYAAIGESDRMTLKFVKPRTSGATSGAPVKNKR